MKILLFIFVTIFTGNVFVVDIIDDVSLSFKSGDAKEIAEFFSSTVELSILDTEDTYSKAQAELIIKDFFFKHTPLTTKVIHRVTSNPNYKFGVIILGTSAGSYRVSYELKNTSGKPLITQIRIEENKQ